MIRKKELLKQIKTLQAANEMQTKINLGGVIGLGLTAGVTLANSISTHFVFI